MEAHPFPDDKRKVRYYIFRPWRRTKSGQILWAKNYGLKAWRIPIY